jgi:acyl-coenzyme A thioesterase PaaI-like protein
MTVNYLKPVPLGKPLIAIGRERYVRGRVHVNEGEIQNEDGVVLARSKGKFIAIDPHKKFAEHLKRSKQSSVVSRQKSRA